MFYQLILALGKALHEICLERNEAEEELTAR